MTIAAAIAQVEYAKTDAAVSPRSSWLVGGGRA